jgi:glutamyl-tRNA synthetase
MTIRTRFAPSPTGYIHVGNARAALFCWMFARRHGGEFMLRLDDTDTERSEQKYAEAIETDLAWLGLDIDLREKQSERFDRYDELFETLKSRGLVYPCYETPEELDLKRKRQLSRGLPPVYDRAALDLDESQKLAFEADGRQAHWRFKLSGNVVVWEDLIRGTQRIETASLSDPVLVRGDGSYLYTLPSVIDDHDFSITHVVRGEDHVTNTATQVEIFEAIGASIPEFAHFSLLQSADGGGLSKRLGVLSIGDLRDMGLEAMSINSLIARLGTADPIEPFSELSELFQGFDFSRLGRAPARLDVEELKRLNKKILQSMPFEVAGPRLLELGFEISADFWDAVRGNLSRLDDAISFAKIIQGSVQPVIGAEDAEFVAQALAELPDGPWTQTTWSEWTSALKAKTERKGKTLFMPLRLALTGSEHGPEMQNLLPLIGEEKTRQRLSGTAG